ncbi:MAG TPA: maleylpyruvate isomerase family mycothiol-dependent enzyme [Acidimicrobiia bacterium]|nr:maleylpyruvate isomerase family mycothiol-dependent enzyme [Acidimicrobiia bacterium]
MEHADYVAAIERDGARLERAARASGVDAPVPSCPGWTVGDLVEHVGRLHRWVAQIVHDRAVEVDAWWNEVEAPAPGTALIDWFAGGYRTLARELADAGPALAVWSWTPFAHTGFWARRQANELAVHRWDGEGALGSASVTPIEPDHAVDVIDEVLDLLPYRRRPAAISGAGETIHLHCTDTDGEWLLRLTPAGVEVAREHAKGDVAARGPASDLALVVLGRVAPSAVDTFGDVSLLERWQRDAAW